MAALDVSLADIEAAAARLDGVIRELPLQGARWLEEQVGGPVRLVTENLQRAGSFKIRGAYYRISQLSDEERARGVVAASAGNHAQGVALAAQMLGVRATVFMPQGATIPKVQATLGYGADVRFHGATLDEAIVEARAYAESSGAVFIPPYDHPDVVAGQGTLGLEIARKMPEARTVVVCTGGGGLLAGTALALKALVPGVRVIGAQAEEAAAYPPSLAAGHPIRLERMTTMADGIAVGLPGDVPFAIIQREVDAIVTVSETELSRAVLLMLERAKLVVEPAGAAAAAAVIADPSAFEPPVAIVLSGGNVDSLLLNRIIRHGLAAAGRFLSFTVRVPDRPGSLARLLDDIRQQNANILEIGHFRFDEGLGINDVDIEVQIETRGHDHQEHVLSVLRERGYSLVVR